VNATKGSPEPVYAGQIKPGFLPVRLPVRSNCIQHPAGLHHKILCPDAGPV